MLVHRSERSEAEREEIHEESGSKGKGQKAAQRHARPNPFRDRGDSICVVYGSCVRTKP